MKAENVKKNLKEIREYLGISQSELARRAGVTPSCVCQIERGKRVPILDVFIRLVKALGVSCERLLE